MTTPEAVPSFNRTCPFPIKDYPQVVMAHGGGGKLTHDLIQKMFLSAFGSPIADQQLDGAVFESPGQILVMSTDSHVISPLFFPGGDIGSLAVYGTTNDVAMCGAHPLYLSVAFILEEGFSMESLWKITQSIKTAADRTGVKIVTGDTKVVDRGKGDGIYINTTGFGHRKTSLDISPRSIQEGDAVIISGDIGRHGIAVMASREGLEFETDLISDCAPLSPLVENLLASEIDIHCMRDLTRGGLATAILEICDQAVIEVVLEEKTIPITGAVRGACEILGLDPHYVANEGCFTAFLPADQIDEALKIIRTFPQGEKAAVIGRVESTKQTGLSMLTEIGTHRIVTMLSGEQLPRIC
jgi:hydrogenase expression/formation protein HypE